MRANWQRSYANKDSAIAALKRCLACRELKSESDYYLQAKGYPWTMSTCKKCHGTRVRLRKRELRERLR